MSMAIICSASLKTEKTSSHDQVCINTLEGNGDMPITPNSIRFHLTANFFTRST